MDELLREFLTETGESLDVIDVELVRFEQEPNNTKILDNIFRLVHTIKGTCGFLGLPRLGSLPPAAEAMIGSLRGGRTGTGDAVTLVLATIDRIKSLLDELERLQREPDGDDGDLIAELQRMSGDHSAPPLAGQRPAGEIPAEIVERARPMSQAAHAAATPPPPAPPAPAPPRGPAASAAPASAPAADRIDAIGREDDRPDGKVANQSIRVHVDTLEHLMTMVSELVLTRNQLIELVRRHEDSEFKGPLQRLSNVTAELQDGVL